MANLSPVWNGAQFFDNQGAPLSGGFVKTCKAGSFTSLLTTYSDLNGTIPNANPIQLDSSGRLLTELWLQPGKVYNLILLSADNIMLDHIDNVSGLTSTGGGCNCSIEDLSDVYINGLYNGDALTYDGSRQKWVNTPSGGGGGGTPKYIATLYGQSAGNFGGGYFNDWSINTIQSSDFVFTSGGTLTFQAYGVYKVTTMCSARPSSGTWPKLGYPTQHGTAMWSSYTNLERSTHYTLNPNSGGDFSTMPNPDFGQNLNIQQWTDEFLVVGSQGTDVTPQLYAACYYPGTSAGVFFTCQLIIEKINS